jgi:hypothetical protein
MLIIWLACANPPPEWYYGEDLSRVQVIPIAWDEGVYPDTSVLDDPNNPFARGIDDVSKWQVLSTDCAPGFYAFATALAQRPTGEHQFYTSHCLQELYEGARLDPDDTFWGWSAAVSGYQTIIDEFPDDVTYDANGTIATPVAPLAWDAMVAMGAKPEGERP